MSMTKTISNRVWLGALTLGVASLVSAQTTTPTGGQSMLKARPSTFTKNIGQWDSKALFGGHAAGMDFWVSKEGFVFQYQRTNADKGNDQYAGHTVGMLFDGAKPFVATGSSEAGVVDYVGDNAKGKAQKYRKVQLTGVYDNVDAVAYFDGKAPRYDFILHPGAKPSDVRFNFKGASAKVVSDKKLKINTVLGDRFQEGLFAYQIVDGKRVAVPVSFKQLDANHIGFNVGAYDKSRDLIIDPLVYGTYYGGDQGFDEVRGVCADSTGSVYLTGYTRSAIYPVLYGPFGFNSLGGKEAFVSRLQGDVYNHDYSALLTGTGDEQGNFIKQDPLGNVWVLGSTTSNTFCGNTRPGNMWLVRFAPSVSTVMTPFLNGDTSKPVLFRFGGTTTANPDVLSITSFNIRPDTTSTPGSTIRLLMTGACKNVGPTGLFQGNAYGCFYGALDYNESTGFALAPSSCGLPIVHGGNSLTLTGSAYDSDGNFFLSGTLNATGNSDTAQSGTIFVTTPGVFQNGRLQRQKDIWVRKMAADGSMLWSGLVGGASDDVTEGFFKTHAANGTDIGGTTVATDPSGNVYVLGRSSSYDFPRTSGVFGEINTSGENYVTVTKIKSDGSQILYSTNIRNGGSINASGIGVDSRGNAYITGVVSAVDQTVAATPPDPYESDNRQAIGSIPIVGGLRATYGMPAIPEVRTNDGWLLILNDTASAVIMSTYIGGILDEGVFAPFVDTNGDVWVYGWVDTWRRYGLVNNAGTTLTWRPDTTGRTGGLDSAFITNLAFKQFPEPNSGPGVRNESDAYFQTTPFGDLSFAGNPNAYSGMSFRRDGFLLRFRESLPLITTMSIAPSPIPGGDPQGLANPPSSTGTINLSAAAPAGGATITLTLNNGTAASFSPSTSTTTQTMIIPAGATSGTFSLYSRTVTAPVNVQVQANYSGNLKNATLQIVPWLSSVTINGSSLVGGNSTTATVKLAAAAPTGGVVVDLSTDIPGVVSFPGGSQVTVPEGADNATFSINTKGVDATTSATINATLLGVVRSATLGINPAKLTTLVLTPNPVAAGGTVTGFVNLNGKTGSAGTIKIAIQGSPAGYVVNPTTVTIPANSSVSNSFTITVPFESTDVSRVVQASRVNGSNVVIDGPVAATLNVQALTVDGITIDPSTIESGSDATATVSLSAAAPAGGARVFVYTDKPGIATPVDSNGVPISEVVVPEGLTQVDFTVHGLFALNGDEDVTVSAYRGPTPTVPSLVKSTNLTVLALTYTMTITPSSVFGGESAVGKIVLSAPAIPGFSMPVTCDNPNVVFAQPVFTTGNDTATFNITTPIVADTTTATFSTHAGTLPDVTATLEIKATEAIKVEILPTNRVRQGSTIRVQVTVNRNVPVATTGKITFSNSSLVSLPVGQNYVNFTVPAGSNKAIVTLLVNRVPRNLSTEVTATCSLSGLGASASTTLFVLI